MHFDLGACIQVCVKYAAGSTEWKRWENCCVCHRDLIYFYVTYPGPCSVFLACIKMVTRRVRIIGSVGSVGVVGGGDKGRRRMCIYVCVCESVWESVCVSESVWKNVCERVCVTEFERMFEREHEIYYVWESAWVSVYESVCARTCEWVCVRESESVWVSLRECERERVYERVYVWECVCDWECVWKSVCENVWVRQRVWVRLRVWVYERMYVSEGECMCQRMCEGCVRESLLCSPAGNNFHTHCGS